MLKECVTIPMLSSDQEAAIGSTEAGACGFVNKIHAQYAIIYILRATVSLEGSYHQFLKLSPGPVVC